MFVTFRVFIGFSLGVTLLTEIYHLHSTVPTIVLLSRVIGIGSTFAVVLSLGELCHIEIFHMLTELLTDADLVNHIAL